MLPPVCLYGLVNAPVLDIARVLMIAEHGAAVPSPFGMAIKSGGKQVLS